MRAQATSPHPRDDAVAVCSDMGVIISRKFLKRMAQPVTDEDQQAVSLTLSELSDPVRVREAIAKTIVS